MNECTNTLLVLMCFHRSLIDRTIPAIDNGKGCKKLCLLELIALCLVYVGSEFWKLQSVVGDDLR